MWGLAGRVGSAFYCVGLRKRTWIVRLGSKYMSSKCVERSSTKHESQCKLQTSVDKIPIAVCPTSFGMPGSPWW